MSRLISFIGDRPVVECRWLFEASRVILEGTDIMSKLAELVRRSPAPSVGDISLGRGSSGSKAERAGCQKNFDFLVL